MPGDSGERLPMTMETLCWTCIISSSFSVLRTGSPAPSPLLSVNCLSPSTIFGYNLKMFDFWFVRVKEITVLLGLFRGFSFGFYERSPSTGKETNNGPFPFAFCYLMLPVQ